MYEKVIMFMGKARLGYGRPALLERALVEQFKYLVEVGSGEVVSSNAAGTLSTLVEEKLRQVQNKII